MNDGPNPYPSGTRDMTHIEKTGTAMAVTAGALFWPSLITGLIIGGPVGAIVVPLVALGITAAVGGTVYKATEE